MGRAELPSSPQVQTERGACPGPDPSPHAQRRVFLPARFGRGCRWTSRGTRQRLPALRRAGWAHGPRGAALGVGDGPVLCSGPVSPARTPPGGRVGHARGARWVLTGPPRAATLRLRPQIRRDYPLNLSILISGGKETNQDSLSSGERRGKSPAPNPRPTGGRGKCGVRKTACPASIGGLSPSDRGSARGRCEAGNGPRRAGARSSRSRVVWECSPKRVVNSI